MLVRLLDKMFCILVLCRVLLIAGVQTLTIDSLLGTSIEDCFERIAIGEQLPNSAIYRNVSELTNRECEQFCKQDKQCQAYDYGVGAKGNATCNLSTLDEKTIKIKDGNPLHRHPDYDVYVRRFQCEQSPPTPIQPQNDEPDPGPSHRPVFRPVVDERPLANDYIVSGDLLSYGKPPVSPDRPDDISNTGPDYDAPPSYGDHRPPEIPYRPSRPSDVGFRPDRPNDKFRPGRPDPFRPERPPYGPERPYDRPQRPERPQDPYRPESNDVLQFQGIGKPRPPPYRPEKPDYHYIIRPNRKPSPQDFVDPTGIYGGYPPGPIGPPDRPYKPERPYEKPIYSYHGQYASNYGQNLHNDNSIYVEIHDPPRPYIPIKDRPNQQYNGQGYLGYGTYSSQNSYSQNGQYTGSITEIGFDQNRPYDRPQKPGSTYNERPQKPGYGPSYDGYGNPGFARPDPVRPVYGNQESHGSSQGGYGSNQGTYGSNQVSNNKGSYNNKGSSNRPQDNHGSQGNYGAQRPDNSNYGETGYKPDNKPSYQNQGSYGVQNSYKGSYTSSYHDQSSQTGYGSQSFESHRPSYDNRPGYGQSDYQRPQKPSKPVNKPYQDFYGNNHGNDQDNYGVIHGSYGGNHGSHSQSQNGQNSYGSGSSFQGSNQGNYGSSNSGDFDGTQNGYGTQNSYGNNQGYGNSHGYGGSQGYGNAQGGYGSQGGSYGISSSHSQSYGENQYAEHSSYGHQGYGNRPYRPKPGYGDYRPDYDNRPDYDDGRPEYGGQRPNYNNQRPDYNGYGQKPSYGERPDDQNSGYGQRPGYGNEKPSYDSQTDYNQKPGYSQKPINDDQNSYGQTSGYGETKPSYGETKPSYGETKPSSGETKPSYGETKPSYDNQTDYRPDVKPVYEYEIDKPTNVPAYIAKPGGEVVTSKPVAIGDYERPGYKEPAKISYQACFKRVLAGQRALRSFVQRVVPCERLEDCRRECATERRFHCESFNYRLDPSFRGKGLCELMTKPIESFDLFRDFVQDKDYDFYEVDRNSLEPNCPETLRGPGLLHSGFLSSKDRPTRPKDDWNDRPNRPNMVEGWRDRNWVDRGSGYSYNERYKGGNRRYEDKLYVPYQIGLARSDDDTEKWGQYGGIYGGASYYKNRNDYHKSINYWGLTSERPSYGVKPYYTYGNDQHIEKERHNFDYHTLGKDSNFYDKKVFDFDLPTKDDRFEYHLVGKDKDFDSFSKIDGKEYFLGEDYYGIGNSQPRYGFGSWKRWNTSGVTNVIDFSDDHSLSFFEPVERSDEPSTKDCFSRRRPGMSLSTGAIRRSLVASSVISCEAACFGEKEFKCVSYSYRYSNSRGSDNCFLSERPFHGLSLSADTASDVYAMPQDHGCSTVSHTPWIESECFYHVRSDTAVSGPAVKSSLTVAGLGACEAECIRAQGFFCRGFSFRFDSPTIGDDVHNCILTSSPPTSLTATGGGDRGHELYARGNYGRGCEPALDLRDDGECYLQYDKAAKLTPSATKGLARVESQQACSSICSAAPFKCLSFSYRNNAPPDTDNCLLSEIRLFDLQRDVDYVHSIDDWLFAFDLFNEKCWKKEHSDEPTFEVPHPIIHTSSEEDDSFLPLPPSGISEPSYIPGSGPPSGSSYSPDKHFPSSSETHYPLEPHFRPGSTYPDFKPEYKPPDTYKPSFRPDPEPFKPGYRPEDPDTFKPGYQPDSERFKPGYRPDFEPYKPGFRPDPSGYKPSPEGPPLRPPDESYRPFRPDRPYTPGYKPIPEKPDGYKPAFRPPEPYPVKPDGFRPGTSGFEAGYDRPGYLPTDKPGKKPGQGDREGGTGSTWRHYTVSGLPCRARTACARNVVAGHWACEPEGGEVGSWDYCCAPSHRCGYSEGFHKPWCYVGDKEDQWRPCSEKYYPYHQHNVPHPSQGHRDEGRPSRPWRESPYKPDYIPHWDKRPGPYLSEEDKKYWDDLYENGPRAYYDKFGNPLPGYSRVPMESRPRIRNRYNNRPGSGSGSGSWVPLQHEDPTGLPGGLGAPRYWPVAYLHKSPPPNMTYFRYNESKATTTTEKHDTTTPPPLSRELPSEPRIPDRPNDLDAKSSRDDKKINISNTDDVSNTELENVTSTNNTTTETIERANASEAETMKTESYKALDKIDGIDDKLSDFSRSIEVLDIEDAKSDRLSDLKTLEAEEKQIEAIGRLLASRRGTKLVLEKRSQKDFETKNIAVDQDMVDFNFGNRFPTERRAERRGVIKRISKDEIEKDRNIDKSLEVSETTFVRPPRVLSTTENIRKAVVNGKVFYDATIREPKYLFTNATNKLRREDTPFVTKSFREQRDVYINSTRKPYFKRLNESVITNITKERDQTQSRRAKSLKLFDDVTVSNKNFREERDVIQNSTRKPKIRRLEDTTITNFRERDLLNSTRKSRRLEDTSTPSVIGNNNFGKRKVLKPRNVNPVRRVRRVYRKRYNPEEVRKRLLERDRNKTSTESSRIA